MENNKTELVDVVVGPTFPQKVTPLIDEAKASIKIIVFDWRWYESNPGSSVQIFNQSFVRAVRRGVRISVVANNKDIIRVLRPLGIDAKSVGLKSIVHAKLMIIDDCHVVIGSHNYTQNAFTMNQEISVLIRNCEQVNDFLRFFNSIWQS